MTPKEIEGKRYWTPKLVSYTLVSQVISVGILGSIAYLSVLWMDTTTKGITEVRAEITLLATTIGERHTRSEVWRQATTDRMDGIQDRLAFVEKKVFNQGE